MVVICILYSVRCVCSKHLNDYLGDLKWKMAKSEIVCMIFDGRYWKMILGDDLDVIRYQISSISEYGCLFQSHS